MEETNTNVTNLNREEVLKIMMHDDIPWSVCFHREALYGHTFSFGIDVKLKNILVGAMLAYYGTKEERQ